MNNLLKFIIGILLLSSCTNRERSKIEIIKLDNELINTIRSNYDSTYIETPNRKDFWTIEHYLEGTKTENIIFKDSLNNIVGIVIRENGANVFAQEYYINGQAEGKTEFIPGKIDGPATYYYEDGRVRSRGIWADYKQVGEWKNYDKDGYLISTEYFNKNGNLEKEEKQN